MSLILTAYKNTQALSLVLESVALQTLKPLEVIVTEDGDDPDNARLLASWVRRMPVPLIHLQQKDLGNRKPLAMNKGIARARGAYLVFVDADCILRSDFLQDHLEFSRPGSFLTGRRVELSPEITAQIQPEWVAQGYFERFSPSLVWDALFGKTQSLGRMIKTPHALRRILGRDQIDDIRGCNFSVAKQAMVDINGCSISFSGAYGEDSDVEYRLKFLGLEMKSIKGAAIQFHLYHPTQAKDLRNQELLQILTETRNPVAPHGLRESVGIE